ncbi:MAG: hypothetical protein JWO46_1487 [Nocardioidaceae bacterium]|nr:hypothetical protein [Nocardioidaceae bacterium]
MSRLADPTLCPDCRSLVRPDAVCSGCGLTLTGPLATELWTTMLSADAILERLRFEAPAPVAISAAPVSVPPAPVAATAQPPYPAPPAVPSARSGLGARAVPVLLLGLGGLLVLTAVSIFLAVTWSILPLAVKAVIMVAVTGGLGAVAVVLSRKALRGSAEAFWAITASLLALDLSAAYRSGLAGLDALSVRTMTGVGAVVVAAAATGAAVWLRGTPLRRSIAAEIAAAIALLVVSLAWFWSGPLDSGLGQTLGILAFLAVAAALRTTVRPVAFAALTLSGLSWMLLAAEGAAHGFDAADRADFWTGFDGWPLVVTAVVAAAVTVLPQVPTDLRPIPAGGALVCLGLLPLLPPDGTTLEVLIGSAVVLALAVVARFAGAAWSPAALVLGGIAAVVGLLGLVITPAALVAAYVGERDLWTTALSDRFPVLGGPSGWTLVAVLLAVVAVALASRRAEATTAVRTLAPGLLGLAVTSGLATSTLPMWSVTAALVATTGVAATAAVLGVDRVRIAAAALGAEAAVLALVVASRSDLASALVASVLLLVGAALFVRTRSRDTAAAPVLVAGSVLAAGYAAGTWSLVADVDDAVLAVLVAAVACASVIASAYLGRTTAQRVATEAAAALVGVAAVLAALFDADVLALVLTLLGSAAAVSAVLRTDRSITGWVSAAVLFAATLVRLGTDHRIAPELYAVPAAALLLVVGGIRLVRTPSLGSWRLLGSGLNLALVPSTLIAFAQPDSWRTVVVIVGGAIAVALGVRRHWQAPFLVGGAVLVVIALRFLLPLAASILANPLGAWMLFGATGAALLVAGVLWEQSLRNLRTASRFVGALE